MFLASFEAVGPRGLISERRSGSSNSFSMGQNGPPPTAFPDAANAADGGSGVASDPLDGGAYLVVNYIVKS